MILYSILMLIYFACLSPCTMYINFKKVCFSFFLKPPSLTGIIFIFQIQIRPRGRFNKHQMIQQCFFVESLKAFFKYFYIICNTGVNNIQ